MQLSLDLAVSGDQVLLHAAQAITAPTTIINPSRRRARRERFQESLHPP
jgi:hypothetical protein